MTNRDAAPKRSRSSPRATSSDSKDAIDESLIAALRQNGRMGNRDLARLAGVSEATVRNRLRKLEDGQSIKVVAMRDLRASGFNVLAAVGVQVSGRPVRDVGADLARLEQAITVSISLGLEDLEVQVIARDLAELGDFLTNVMAQVPGVSRLVPGLALNILKYNPEWAPL